MPEQPVPLVELALSLPEPPLGWEVELDARGVPVFPDDVGRPSISRDAARQLLAEHREQQEAAARRRVEIEQRAVEADQRFRASLPAGIPAGAVPDGISAGQLMMLSDPERQGSRRESVLQHALANGGSAVYHPINEDAAS
jgi:hypothetical protein